MQCLLTQRDWLFIAILLGKRSPHHNRHDNCRFRPAVVFASLWVPSLNLASLPFCEISMR